MGVPLRVLSVEDSPDDAELIGCALRRGGYEPVIARVETAAAMRDALERERWDVVVADFSLPGFSAPAALALLTEMQLDLPFIIVSGTVGEEDAVAAMRAGAHDYLMKGNLTRLPAAVQRELREAAHRTARRDAERALRSSETFLRAVVDNVAEGLIVLDERGNVESFNPAAERIFGYTAAQVIGAHVTRLVDGPTPGAPLSLAQLTGPAREIVGQRRDGTTLPLELALSPMRLGDRNLIIAVLRDITERKRAEAQHEWLLAREQAARVEAESANRAKDEFLSTLSHELRTPLTPTLVWLRLMRTRRPDEATLDRALAAIERNTQLQVRLVEDILDLSRIITGKFHLDLHDVPLAGIIASAVDLARPSAETKDLRLEITIGPGTHLVSGDAARLQQVVWNLLSNAIKFTPKGGVIEIRLERSDDRARIVVTDTGLGIDAGLLPHVFDRFRQADSSSTRKHGGLGLGLAIVRHLVELHGGVARAESRGEGQGATFTVELPQQDPEKTSRVAKQTPAARGPGVAVDRVPVPEGVRVLLVEDDTDTRDVLEMALRRCKADVTAVGSAADAVAAIDRSLPDVLVCDIGMPGEDGYALIGKLRARPPERGGRIPAIALTAFVQVEDRQRALRAGFQAHVAKPVDPADVAAVVWSLARRTRGAHVATGPR